MEKKRSYIGEICVLVSAVLWGLISIVTRPLGEMGFSALQMTAVRSVMTVVVMAVILLIKDKRLFKIRLKDIPIFIGTGIVSFLFFNFCYMSSIEQNSVSVAAMLLYTSPIWITIISAIVFKEKITLVKIISLVGAILGAGLITLSQGGRTTVIGILFGIGSGIGYALYTIFGKFAARRYSFLTTVFYTFVFSSIGAIPLCNPVSLVNKIIVCPNSLIYFGVCTVFMTVLPYIFYTVGMYRISAGKAGIIAILEPVVASIVGVAVYQEGLGVVGIVGIVLVVLSLVLLEIKGASPPPENPQTE
ncbi:MAG: hypothetical protein E7369_01155 [Clostridiales bacterium]|nr:hypothetical protein [Clostridiales bacterium]